MRAGTQTGSLFNHLMTRSAAPVMPKVGDGATICGWTDRYAATVVAVEKNVVTVRQDHARRTDSNGMSEMQEYEYTPNPNGSTYAFRYSVKKGKWDQVYFNSPTGRWKIVDGKGVWFGTRNQYHDFSF